MQFCKRLFLIAPFLVTVFTLHDFNPSVKFLQFCNHTKCTFIVLPTRLVKSVIHRPFPGAANYAMFASVIIFKE